MNSIYLNTTTYTFTRGFKSTRGGRGRVRRGHVAAAVVLRRGQYARGLFRELLFYGRKGWRDEARF